MRWYRGVYGSRCIDVVSPRTRVGDRFPSDERSVVTLRQARKALSELGPDVSHAVAVAMGLTDEADAELRGHGVIVARVGSFFWTEDSYLRRTERQLASRREAGTGSLTSGPVRTRRSRSPE